MVSSRSGLPGLISCPANPYLLAHHADVWKEILKKKDPATYTKYQLRFEDDQKSSSKATEPRWRKVYLVRLPFQPVIYAVRPSLNLNGFTSCGSSESLGERGNPTSQRCGAHEDDVRRRSIETI